MADVAHRHSRVEVTQEDGKGCSADFAVVSLLFEANHYIQVACCQSHVRREGHHGARGVNVLRDDSLPWHDGRGLGTVAQEENAVSCGNPTLQGGWSQRVVSLIMDAVADATEVERNGLTHIPFVCPRDGWSREGLRAFIEGLRQRSGYRADRIASVVVKAGFDVVARYRWSSCGIAIVSGEGDHAVRSAGRVDSMIYGVRRAVAFKDSRLLVSINTNTVGPARVCAKDAVTQSSEVHLGFEGGVVRNSGECHRFVVDTVDDGDSGSASYLSIAVHVLVQRMKIDVTSIAVRVLLRHC